MLLMVPLISVVIHNFDLRGFQLLAKYVNKLYFEYATLLRQSTLSITPLGLIAMTTYSIVVLSRYEYYHTSQLVVPNTYKPISSLKEFVEKGYKIKRSTGDWETLLKTTFQFQNLEKLYKEAIINLSHIHVNEIIETYSKDDPKFGHLDGGPKLRIRYIKYKLLKGDYDCYSFVWATEYYYFIWYVSIFNEVKGMSDALEEGGFPGVWKLIDKTMSGREDGKVENKDRKSRAGIEEPSITFVNLTSFFILLICLCGGWILVLGVEMGICKYQRNKQ